MRIEPEQGLLRAFPTLVWSCGPERAELTWVNDVWLEFTGRTLEDERGFGFLDLVHPEDRERVVELFVSHHGRREPYEVEYRMRRHDGVYRWLHELGRPIESPDGRFEGFVGACYDVTDRREALDRLEASEARNRLLMQTIFHDLAGPLAAATSATDLLRSQADAEGEDGHVLALLEQQHTRMSDLLEELRHLDMAEHGEPDHREQVVTIAEVLDDLVDALDTGDRTLHRSFANVEVEVDTLLLCRALENVLRNAAVHTPAGTTIWVSSELVDGRPTITIEDDGPGLPTDRSELFEPYRRGDVRGTSGLGLSIAHRYLQAIDGKITASERPGGGARFVVELAPVSTAPDRD